jgi:hypothetical protein
MKLAFGEDSHSLGEGTPRKKAKPGSSSLDLVADLCINASKSCDSAIAKPVSERTEFRLLFGSPPKSATSPTEVVPNSPRHDNDGVVHDDEDMTSTADSSYEGTEGEISSLDGMTHDDRSVMNNYIAQHRPALSYMSGSDEPLEDGKKISAENCRKTPVGVVIKPLAEMSTVDSLTINGLPVSLVGEEARNEVEKANGETCVRQLTGDKLVNSHSQSAGVTVCYEIESNDELFTEGSKCVDGEAAADKGSAVNDRGEECIPSSSFATGSACLPSQLRVNPTVSKTSLRDSRQADVIIIPDDDEDEMNDRSVALVVIDGSQGSKGSNTTIGSQPLDSDATTVDIVCSPYKPMSASLSSNKNVSIDSKLCCDSDIATNDGKWLVPQKLPCLPCSQFEPVSSCDSFSRQDSDRCVPSTRHEARPDDCESRDIESKHVDRPRDQTLVTDFGRIASNACCDASFEDATNAVGAETVSSRSSSPDDCFGIASPAAGRASSADDDLLIYLDSSTGCQPNESSGWATWTSTRAKRPEKPPGARRSSLARKKRGEQKAISGASAKCDPSSAEASRSDTDTDRAYDADAESESDADADKDVYLPVFRFKMLPLHRRPSPPTSTDSDTGDDVEFGENRGAIFGRYAKCSRSSSPWSSWSSWSKEEGAAAAAVTGDRDVDSGRQKPSSRLRCSGDGERDDLVVLISDGDDAVEGRPLVDFATPLQNRTAAGCARMLTADDVALVEPCAVEAMGSDDQTSGSSNA